MIRCALCIFVDYNTPTMRFCSTKAISTLMCLLVSFMYVKMHVPIVSIYELSLFFVVLKDAEDFI